MKTWDQRDNTTQDCPERMNEADQKSCSDPASWQIDQKSEKGVFRRGHQKAGTAGFTPHTMIDAARLAVDEIAGI